MGKCDEPADDGVLSFGCGSVLAYGEGSNAESGGKSRPRALPLPVVFHFGLLSSGGSGSGELFGKEGDGLGDDLMSCLETLDRVSGVLRGIELDDGRRLAVGDGFAEMVALLCLSLVLTSGVGVFDS